VSLSFFYIAYALTIESEIELPELPVISEGVETADVRIRVADIGIHRIRRPANEVLVSVPDVGWFLVRGGHEIVIQPCPNADMGQVKDVLLGRAMACLLRQLGWLTLHASGVLIDEMAVLFVGPSGAGKSTTAAAFHARGHKIVADDVAAVRTIAGKSAVRPAWSYLRLLANSLTVLEGQAMASERQGDKYRFDLGKNTLLHPFTLKSIYFLSRGSELRLEAVREMDAIRLLSENTLFCRARQLPEVIAGHLSECASLASTVKIRRLTRRRSLDDLPQLVRLVEEDLAGLRSKA
jgi:hypothetical protein